MDFEKYKEITLAALKDCDNQKEFEYFLKIALKYLKQN